MVEVKLLVGKLTVQLEVKRPEQLRVVVASELTAPAHSPPPVMRSRTARMEVKMQLVRDTIVFGSDLRVENELNRSRSFADATTA